MKKLLCLFCLMQLLMSTQCEEDIEPIIFKNNFKVEILSQTNLNINDTIWIEGRVSSKVYNSQIGDSTFADYPERFQISVYKFITPTTNYNAKDAIDKFDLIYPNQLIDRLGSCNNSTMIITPTLNATGSLFKFKLGLKAQSSGDFLLKFSSGQKIENIERNLNIINNYPSPNNNFLIGLNSCNNNAWLDENDVGDFCFHIN